MLIDTDKQMTEVECAEAVEAAAHNMADSGNIEGAAFLRGAFDGISGARIDESYKHDDVGYTRLSYMNGYFAGQLANEGRSVTSINKK